MNAFFIAPDSNPSIGDNQCKLAVPWGLLPFLSIGNIYVDGRNDGPCSTWLGGKEITSGTIDIASIRDCSPTFSRPLQSDIPLFAEVVRRPDYYKFKTVGGEKNDSQIYIVSSVAIIQCFFGQSSWFARHLLSSFNFDDIVENSYISSDGKLSIYLAEDILRFPKTDDFSTSMLGWYLLDDVFSNEWKAAKSNYQQNRSLRAKIPKLNSGTLRFRGLQFDNYTFILSFTSLDDVNLPFSSINLYHYAESRIRIHADGDHASSHAPTEPNTIRIDGLPASNVPTTQIKIPGSTVKFSVQPKIKRTAKQGKKSVSHIVNEANTADIAPQPLTVQDRLVGGSAPQANLQAVSEPELSLANAPADFHQFVKVINELICNGFLHSCSIDYIPIPSHNRFSNKNNSPRQYALCRGSFRGREIGILEISTTPNEHLSTLIFRSGSSYTNSATDLIESLGNNSGQWNKKELSQFKARGCSVDLVRHCPHQSQAMVKHLTTLIYR